MYVWLHGYKCLYVCMYVSMAMIVYTYVCTYVCMYVCLSMYVCICICICECLHVFLSFITIKSSRAFFCLVFGMVYVSYASIEILLTSTSSINIYRVMQYLVVNVSSFFSNFRF